MDNIFKNIGSRIREERKKLGYSQDELADRSGLHTTYIGGIERGEKNPTVTTLQKISDALNIPLFQLFKFNSEKPDEEDIVVIDEIVDLYKTQSKRTKRVIKRMIQILGEDLE